jgi:hypothetical protein
MKTFALAVLAVMLTCPQGLSKPHRASPDGLPDPQAEIARILRPDFAVQLVAAAIERTKHDVVYDGSYRRLRYPMGDVPLEIGVCTDLVIRSYRKLGIDLQKEVHEDMSAAFQKYPKKWGLSRPDTNIDHRRVLNLEIFFARKGVEVAVTSNPEDYFPGDLVTWTVGGSLPHIGIVTDKMSSEGERPLIVHNIGAGPKLEDVLFSLPIVGHFRYAGPGNEEGDSRRWTAN